MMRNGLMGSLLATSIFGLLVANALCSSHENSEEYTQPGEIPYQVSVQLGGEHICSGALIDDNHVLTAAQCFADLINKEEGKETGSELNVVAGTSDLSNEFGKVVRKIVEVAVPADYNTQDDRRIIKDIAVLKLNASVGIGCNPNVGSVNVPMTKEQYASKYAMSTGFLPLEKLENDGSYTYGPKNSKLTKVSPLVIHNQVCKSVFRDLKGDELDSHLCTYPFAVNSKFYRSCVLDVGAPLVHDKTTVIGISSGARGVCGKEPNLYTRVSSYLEFIVMAQRGDYTSEMRVIRL